MCDSEVPAAKKTTLTYALSSNVKAWGYAGIALSQALMCLTFQQLPADSLVVGNRFDRMSRTTAKRAVNVMEKALVAAASCECEGNSGLFSNTAIALAHLASTSAVVGGNLLLPDSVRSLAGTSVVDMGDAEKLAEVLAGSEAFLQHLETNIESIDELACYLDDFSAGAQKQIDIARDGILAQANQQVRHESNLYVNAIKAAIKTLRAGIQALKDARSYVFSIDKEVLKKGGIQTLNAVDVVRPITFDSGVVNVEALGFQDSDVPAQYWSKLNQTMSKFVQLVNVYVRANLYVAAYRQAINRMNVYINFGKPADSEDSFFQQTVNVGYSMLQTMLVHMSGVSNTLCGELSAHLLHELDRDSEYAVDVLQRQDFARKQNAVVQAERLKESAIVQKREAEALVELQQEILVDVNKISKDIAKVDPWQERTAQGTTLPVDIDRYIMQKTETYPLTDMVNERVPVESSHPLIDTMARSIQEDLTVQNYSYLTTDFDLPRDFDLRDSKQILQDEIKDMDGTSVVIMSLEEYAVITQKRVDDEKALAESARTKQLTVDHNVNNAGQKIAGAESYVVDHLSDAVTQELFDKDMDLALNRGFVFDTDHIPGESDFEFDDIRRYVEDLLRENPGGDSFGSLLDVPLQTYQDKWKMYLDVKEEKQWEAFGNFMWSQGQKINAGYSADTFDYICTGVLLTRDEGDIESFESALFTDTKTEETWMMGIKFLEERRSEYLGIKVRVHDARSKAWHTASGMVKQQQERWNALLNSIAKHKRDTEVYFTHAKQARTYHEDQFEHAKDMLVCAQYERNQAESSMRVITHEYGQ
jgi:hypothetical protein